MDLAPISVRAITRIPYGDLGGFSSLFVDYAAGAEPASEFYSHQPSLAGLSRSAEAAVSAPHAERESLVRLLQGQQPRWGEDPRALENAGRLRDPQASVIITGQQVGLLTGPTYTVLKALTTVILARKLEAETGRPVIPVFWLGSDDHDLVEMASTWVPGPSGPVHLHYEGHSLPESGNLGPVGSLEFGPGIDVVIDLLESSLPATDFRQGVMEAVRNWYRPGQNFCDAFGGLLRTLLPGSGLVLFSAADPEAKALSAPLWKKEVRDWESSDAALQATTARVEAAYHAQVHLRPTNLFLLHDGMRLPIDADEGGFSLRGTTRRWTRGQLADLLDRSPELFSPNVVLRPLTQDWLFPTAAYVAGPGETAYFAQYRSVYEWAGIPMPVIYPRVSATFVEPGIRRKLDKLEIHVGEFRQDSDALFARIARERMELDVEERFDAMARQVDALVSALAPEIETVDASLKKTGEATRASVQKEIFRLRDRVHKANRRNQEQLRLSIEKVRGALFPDGTPQERLISPVYFVSKYGMAFFSDLLEDLDEGTLSHLILDV
jgi:bacillithiol synthase